MFVEHWKLSVLEENNVVLNENSVEGKPCINIESNILDSRGHDALPISMSTTIPRSYNTNLYLSWLLHLEDVLGGKFHM